jgi:hypothetical protein
MRDFQMSTSRPRFASLIALLSCGLMLIGCSSGNSANNGQERDVAVETGVDAGEDTSAEPIELRVATFNASLYRSEAGQLARDLAGGDDSQARSVAEVVQRMRPDVLLINEFDWDADGTSARLFHDEYLAQPQGDAEAITYDFRHVPATNTGIHSGADLNNDGTVSSDPGSRSYGNDAFGYGTFPGQYGFVIYSKYPISEDSIRTFQEFLWKDMPENLIPREFYTDAAIDVFRLSSKNHVDVPVRVGERTVHVLASHPTPPSFDGDEDRNGRRNHDEIRFWVDYVAGGSQAEYISDDQGGTGGLSEDARFVVVGDLNSDPNDGGSRHAAIRSLLEAPQVTDPQPASEGAVVAAQQDGQANTSHTTEPRFDTADFSDGRVGNLRVDYALPSSNLNQSAAGVFWPEPGEEFANLVDVSDHRLVWVDLTVE